MAKVKLTLTIDEKIKNIAKKYIPNVSEYVEASLREALRDIAFKGKIDKNKFLKSCPICGIIKKE